MSKFKKEHDLIVDTETEEVYLTLDDAIVKLMNMVYSNNSGELDSLKFENQQLKLKLSSISREFRERGILTEEEYWELIR